MRLNLDAGELPDEPPALWAQFDILNIACGGHAGDTASMSRVVAFCVAHSIAIGAHPSYPDREHFGRRTLAITAEDLHESLVTQLRSLARIALARDTRVQFAKPHGALYHDASRDPALAVIVVDAIATALGDVTIIGPRGHLERAARAAGFAFAVEGFADRAIRPDGSLVPRSEPNALITSPTAAAAQAIALARGDLAGIGKVDTICVHADTPGSLAIARAVRGALEGALSRSASSASAPAASAPSASAPAASAPSASAPAASATAFVALGDRAIRFPRPPSVSSRALVDAIRRWPAVSDVVVARHDIAAYFTHTVARSSPAATQQASADVLSPDLERRIAELVNVCDLDEPVREIELRAFYDGADLDDVARACGLSTAEVISAHVGAVYDVDTLGFAPGFAYLVGLDPRLHVPRRATPRARIPAGALAIASEYTAVYPFESPGGWNLIGRVDEKMFDPHRGARLQMGDRVRFVR